MRKCQIRIVSSDKCPGQFSHLSSTSSASMSSSSVSCTVSIGDRRSPSNMRVTGWVLAMLREVLNASASCSNVVSGRTWILKSSSPLAFRIRRSFFATGSGSGVGSRSSTAGDASAALLASAAAACSLLCCANSSSVQAYRRHF